MSNSGNNLGNLISSILSSLRRIFTPGKTEGGKPPVTPPRPSVDITIEPARLVTARVLLIIHDPIMDPATGQKLSGKMNWPRVDDLVTGFIADITETSAGMARYQVVQRVEVDDFPVKIDGFRYDPASYMNVLRGGAPHSPAMADYQAILTCFDILTRVARREIDEVWLFAFPHAGFYESRMAGARAFWCNAPPVEDTFSCSRRFVIMGFSLERGVGEMLESFGHRCESILIKTFENASPGRNLYERFSRYDRQNPGMAEVGNIHFAPNSDSDYDWNNPRLVPSRCDNWLHFPTLPLDPRMVNANEWGNGDIRLHHRWWLRHLPRVGGRTTGIANNWWQYLLDPNSIYL